MKDVKMKVNLTPTQRLARLRTIYERQHRRADGTWSTNHARLNLMGACFDLEQQGADPLCVKTIKRIIKQLASMEQFLKIRS